MTVTKAADTGDGVRRQRERSASMEMTNGFVDGDGTFQ